MFFNQELQKEHSSKSVELGKDIPGSLQNIIHLCEAHYQRGELYMEFLKGGGCCKSSSMGNSVKNASQAGGLVPQ